MALPDNGAKTPWAYLWAISIPCDGCGRRFPMIGANRLRFPNANQKDPGLHPLARRDHPARVP